MGESPFGELVGRLVEIIDAMHSSVRRADQKAIASHFQSLVAFTSGLRIGMKAMNDEACLDAFLEQEAERNQALENTSERETEP